MKNPFRVDKLFDLFGRTAESQDTIKLAIKDTQPLTENVLRLLELKPLGESLAKQIFAELDKIIISGYPYKRFHPRKYNMLKKKYL